MILPRFLPIAASLLLLIAACEDNGGTPSAPTDPDAPSLRTPDHEAVVTDAVSLAWTAGSGFPEYHVMIASDTAFSHIVWDTLVAAQLSCVFTRGVQGEMYFWRVGGMQGTRTYWSETRSFTLQQTKPDAWTRCRLTIAGIAVAYELRTIRTDWQYNFSDTSFTVAVDTIGAIQLFRRRSQGGELFSADTLFSNESYPRNTSYDNAWLEAFVRASDMKLDSLRWTHKWGSHFWNTVGMSTTQSARNLIHGHGIESAARSPGLYRIDDRNTLEALFTAETERASSTTDANNNTEIRTVKILNVQILDDAFIELRFE